jgi:hypothetical protein
VLAETQEKQAGVAVPAAAVRELWLGADDATQQRF